MTATQGRKCGLVGEPVDRKTVPFIPEVCAAFGDQGLR